MSGHRESASVVVIGAGCIGAAIAYHLALRRVEDVVVLEKEPYAGAGSTSKAAGGIRAQFSTPINVSISMMAIEAYERFAAEMETDPATCSCSPTPSAGSAFSARPRCSAPWACRSRR